MKTVYSIDTCCLRYVIPFKFKESFDEAIRAVVEKTESYKSNNDEAAYDRKAWHRRLSAKIRTESDLYDYIKDEFRFTDEAGPLPDEKAGCEWIYWRGMDSEDKIDGRIVDLTFFPEGIKKKDIILPDKIDIVITNVGLSLFRNGLGLFWYELKLPDNSIDSEKLKKFQNEIKELNRDIRLWKKNKSSQLEPFSIGLWMNELLDFIHIEYFAKRKANYPKMFEAALSATQNIEQEIFTDSYHDFESPEYAPDKAILFTFATASLCEGEDTPDDRRALSYHLTNGYTDSYKYSSDISENMMVPFGDAIWYATKEGASYLAWPIEDNRQVYNSLIPKKFTTDYFVLYLKTLYQSFSMLIYAEMIQQGISAVKEDFNESSLSENVTGIFAEINLFLTKAMATSVSHIHHQNEFYIYLKQQLCVHEDIKSVTSGLNALNAIIMEQRHLEEKRRANAEWLEERERDRRAQEEKFKIEAREKKRDEKIQTVVNYLAILGIASALVDSYDYITKFSAEGGFSSLSIGFKVGTLACGVVILALGIRALYWFIKSKTDKDSEE